MAFSTSELKKHRRFIINLIFHFCKMEWFYGWFGDPQNMLTGQKDCKWEMQFWVCYNNWTHRFMVCSERCQPVTHSPRRRTVEDARSSSHRQEDQREETVDLAKIWQYCKWSSYLNLIKSKHISLAATSISSPHLSVTSAECYGGPPNSVSILHWFF